jgi:hypothetical protein
MTSSRIHIHISPYRRIVSAGFDITIKKHATTQRIQLIKGVDIIAFADCPRTSNLAPHAMLEKARRGMWGPTSAMYQALEALAFIAEANTTP